MKIIVTGGAGFIGSHIVDVYINLGHDVAVVDNLATGRERNVHPQATFYKEDLRDAHVVERIFSQVKPDIVNHHAALAAVTASVKNPKETFEVNVLGTVNLLTAGGNTGIQKFIFSSTGGAIYGDPKRNPVNEGYPAKPLSPYGLSKLLAEACVEFYAHRYGFEHLIFRYPNVYGPRQNPEGEAGIVAIFGELIQSGQQPTIFGDGTKTRDYVYIDDIVNANEAALTKGSRHILNLGWGEEVTDRQMFDEIASALSFERDPVYAPVRGGEVNRIALDASQAAHILGWKPRTSLKEGIRKTLRGESAT